MYTVYFCGSGALNCKRFKSFLAAQVYALKLSLFGHVVLSVEFEPKPKY